MSTKVLEGETRAAQKTRYFFRMDKTADVSVRRNQWQRILRWHQKQRVEDGDVGDKNEGKHDTNPGQKLKFK